MKCEHCGKREGTQEVCRWILTDIDWPKWCESCVEEELIEIRRRYSDDVQLMMDVTDALFLGPMSVRDKDGNLLPTYGVKYPR